MIDQAKFKALVSRHIRRVLESSGRINPPFLGAASALLAERAAYEVGDDGDILCDGKPVAKVVTEWLASADAAPFIISAPPGSGGSGRTPAAVPGGCSLLPATSNDVTVPADEDAPWNATGCAWGVELEAIGQSKPNLQGRHMRLHRVAALVPVSEELLEDSALFDSWVRTALPARIAAKLQTAIIRGSGAGMPQGILEANCAIDVPRASAGAVGTTDFANMFALMHGEGRKRAVWLANADVTVPSTPGLPLKMHGSDVEWLEACSEIGDRGDLIFADLEAYQLCMRGLAIATSIHAFFDVAAVGYRFLLRVVGQPTWSKAYPGQFSATERSPFIVLADAEA